MATYTGRFATVPWRTLSTIASIRITGYTASSGRDCHSRISARTRPVTVEIRSRDTAVSYTSSKWLAMSPVVIPLAYKEMTLASKPANRR
jgi:hypothetical protein